METDMAKLLAKGFLKALFYGLHISAQGQTPFGAWNDAEYNRRRLMS